MADSCWLLRSSAPSPRRGRAGWTQGDRVACTHVELLRYQLDDIREMSLSVSTTPVGRSVLVEFQILTQSVSLA
jgi:hypothetical protein